jgi:putative hemolysin
MTALIWVAFVVVSLAAALTVAADGMVTALEPQVDSTDNRRWLTNERERVHRDLSGARLMLFLLAGALSPPLWVRTPPAILLALVLCLAVLGVCEVVARTYGHARPTMADGALGSWAVFVVTLSRPVSALVNRTELALSSALPVEAESEAAEDEAAEQFLDVVATETEATPKERTLLEGAFSLGETQVQEIMTPRVELVAVERDTPWSEVIDRFRSSAHSRLPVYAGRIDDVVGVIYAKDILKNLLDDEEPDGGWESRIRPTFFVPPTKPIDALLREFRAKRTHIAIVADEYGGTAGLVTIEDILEEVVGEIEDEHDSDEPRDIESRENREFWVNGRVSLDELSDALGVTVESEEVTTVGGLVMERLGRVARAGEQLEIAGHRVIVERVRKRQVMRVYFERLPEPDPTDAAEDDA